MDQSIHCEWFKFGPWHDNFLDRLVDRLNRGGRGGRKLVCVFSREHLNLKATAQTEADVLRDSGVYVEIDCDKRALVEDWEGSCMFV